MQQAAHSAHLKPELLSLPRFEKLQVSIVVGDLSTRGAGRWGGAVRPFLLAQALQRLGCQVKLVGFCFGEETAIVSTPELPVIAVNGCPYPGFVRSVQQLWPHIQGDLVYAYKPKPSSFGVALLKKWRSNCPVILDIDDWELSWHGGDQWKYQPGLKQLARDILKPKGALRNPDHPLYLKWLEQQVHQADAVTVHTQFLHDRFGGTYVPNGKDIALFNPEGYDPIALKQRYGLANYRVLMFPGAPRPYKGVEDVLRALERLNRPDIRLVIVGGSPYDDYDRQLTEQWGQWMIQLPKIPHSQMPEVIAAADAIVVPQRNTPAAQAQFPLKLTDGMAMAKPILATRVGDIPHILGEAGYLVEPESPEQLAQQIEWILAHPDEAALRGQQARSRCVEQCSIEAMAATLSTVICRFFSSVGNSTVESI